MCVLELTEAVGPLVVTGLIDKKGLDCIKAIPQLKPGGGLHSTEVAYLLLTWQPQGSNLGIPPKISLDVTDIY